MYRILDKDTINIEILPHLSVAKRGYTIKNHLVEIVTGCLRRFYRSIHF